MIPCLDCSSYRNVRGAQPDIDTDFPSAYRDDVKEYIRNRFGNLHTCSVGAYTKLQLKAGLKDFGRVNNLDFSYMNFVTKDIDHQVSYTWRDLIKYALRSTNIYEFCQKYPQIVHNIKFCLEQPRSSSIHASAVLVLPKQNNGEDVDINDWLPVRLMDGLFVAEWEGKYTDMAGFLKEDILGLSQLDKFQRIISLIKKNQDVLVNLDDIDLEDRKTYKLFSKGYNEDVFQFSSSGLKSFSVKVKPDNIEELTAMNALYRPGAMSSNAHEEYAQIKHGKRKLKFDYGLKEITENTYSLIIYQEQIMQSVVTLGGFTLVESDGFRTNMKKFQKDIMATYEDKFVSGAIQRGCDKHEAIKIWNKLLAFGKYGFNKSHSTAYAIIAYWAQWFKANYPLEFWTTSLQFASEDEIPYRISELRKTNKDIEIKPPSINTSTITFECKDNNIYWSLIKIKGVGNANAEYIMNERANNGEFKSYRDFIKRVPKKNVNKKTLLNLILSGCFDEIENINKPSKRIKLVLYHHQIFELEVPDEFTSDDVSKDYFWIFRQKELTGYGNVDYKQLLSNAGLKKYQDIYHDSETFQKAADYKVVCICGVLNFYIEKTTKKGSQYCVMEIVSNNDLIRVVFWEDKLDEYREMIIELKGKVIAITGKAKFEDYSNSNTLYSYEETTILNLS